jgi:Escherichia/Staphylococcus phage prohead protease
MPIQAYSFEVKSLGDAGQFSGIASTYGNRDQQGDVVAPGAFARTLSEGGKQRPLLWQHQQPVGLVTLRDSPAGLLAEGQLSLGVQLAKDAYTLMKDGVVRGLSIGFQTLRDEVKGGVRQLLEVKLFEVSLVTFPANEMASVTSVKSLQRDELSRAARELKEFYAALKIQSNRSNHASR